MNYGKNRYAVSRRKEHQYGSIGRHSAEQLKPTQAF